MVYIENGVHSIITHRLRIIRVESSWNQLVPNTIVLGIIYLVYTWYYQVDTKHSKPVLTCPMKALLSSTDSIVLRE